MSRRRGAFSAVAAAALLAAAGAACNAGADSVQVSSGAGGSASAGAGGASSTGSGGASPAGSGGATGTGGRGGSGAGAGAGGATGAGGSSPTGSGGAGGVAGDDMLPWNDGFEDMAFVTRAWRTADSNGTWSVITDGSKVYQAVGTSTETIAVTGYYAWTDQDVTVKVKVTSAASTSWAVDLLPRLSDLRNYYQLTLSATSVALHVRVDNSRDELVSKYKITTPLTTGVWYTLRFSIKNVTGGALITAWLGDTMALTTTDPMPLASGGVGLGVTDATVEFDDLGVTLPP